MNHKKTQDSEQAALMIPLSKSLLHDLSVLALLAGCKICEYAAHAIDAHVNGQRRILDAVEETQKDTDTAPPPD